MSKFREDDLPGFIAKIEKREASTEPKPDQLWHGRVVVDVGKGATETDEALQSIGTLSRWTLRDVIRGNGWVGAGVSYHARGANADDVDRRFQKAFGVDEGDVAVATSSVEPLDE